MKRYTSIVFVATALLASSCVKEMSSECGYSARPITFVTATYEPQTRAAFTDDSFTVTAWTGDGLRYMNNVGVSRSGSGNVWTTSDAYYWPKTDKLRFVALHGNSGHWASVDSACTTLTTGSSNVVYHPVLTTNQDSLWLYTDRTSEYDYTATNVPIVFRNALAAVKATINVRMGNDVIQKDTAGLYREYDVYAPADSAGKTTYYVVPYGITPNGFIPEKPTFTYPIKVKLKTPITHIWRIVIRRISAINVANTGKLEMSLSSNEWVRPSNSVWSVPETSVAHSDSVILYDATVKKDLNGTPIPANMTDYKCPLSGSFLVMPQYLNWSSVSTINNQKASVEVTVEVYHEDVNVDGVFDYRDVYSHWLCKRDSKGVITDSVLVSNADTAVIRPIYRDKGWSFYKWYEWDGTGSSVLEEVHAAMPLITYAKILGNLTTHLKYPLTTSIDLAKISSDENTHYWKMNTMTTYNIAITPVTDEILFSPEVEKWTDIGSLTAK